MVNEDLKKVEIKDYTPPSRFKVFVLLLFFAGLVVFIIEMITDLLYEFAFANCLSSFSCICGISPQIIIFRR